MDAAATVPRPATPSPLSFVALLVAGLIFLPLLYVISLAVGADGAIWSRLWRTRVPELLANTAAVAAGVAAATAVLGVSLAWLVVRYEFAGRRMWEWALVLPLT